MDVNTAIELIYSLLSIFVPPLLSCSVKYQQIQIKTRNKAIQKELSAEISKIPKNKLIEPNLPLLYSALQSYVLQSGQDEIKNLFVKLISASFNSDKMEYLHPCFVEIIKQLSPIEARILLSIYDSNKIDGISALKDNREYLLVSTPYLKTTEDINMIDLAISNLIRLHLIHVSSHDSATFFGAKDGVVSLNTSEPLSPESDYYNMFNADGYQAYKVNAYITNLGLAFFKTCIE